MTGEDPPARCAGPHAPAPPADVPVLIRMRAGGRYLDLSLSLMGWCRGRGGAGHPTRRSTHPPKSDPFRPAAPAPWRHLKRVSAEKLAAPAKVLAGDTSTRPAPWEGLVTSGTRSVRLDCKLQDRRRPTKQRNSLNLTYVLFVLFFPLSSDWKKYA